MPRRRAEIASAAIPAATAVIPSAAVTAAAAKIIVEIAPPAPVAMSSPVFHD